MDDISAYYPPPPPPPPSHHSHFHHPHHHHLPPHPPPPPLHAPPPSASSYPPSPTHHLRTLFVAGLPHDVKPREIYNLFRHFPGYQSSKLRSPSKSNQPFAFAVFADQHYAVAAMHALNGLVFDLEKGSTLYIDLAKSNSRSKRQRTGDDEGFHTDKKSKGSLAFAPRSSSDFVIRVMIARASMRGTLQN